ncbi:hypothetical protein GCM10015535_41960 [Streptomyces gelaticus]|uniref:Uncharacterized protein n=1 Tax=Streptomyces gelaticus TaxID=285446 RepID=A0ABQ2W1H2_9ACTN|nr:hypothetical protein [Streptomyces gelaticus]GGV89094.1 hypothetical protein GCM10015535_41960 [Streptomyces gelaticus]
MATTTASPGQPGDDATQSERLAEELRKNPVYVSADRPRRLPRSLAPDIAALAERTGVPTYVLALPAGDATLLALVHDRLGAKGLYVLIGDHSSVTASAFGVDVPVEEARRIALYGTPYGAGPLTAFESFVDAIASGHDRTAWHEAGHVLPAAREGLEALILKARESASVPVTARPAPRTVSPPVCSPPCCWPARRCSAPVPPPVRRPRGPGRPPRRSPRRSPRRRPPVRSTSTRPTRPQSTPPSSRPWSTRSPRPACRSTWCWCR